MEIQKFAPVDIPGAFMKSEMEGEKVHMKLEGKMTELLTKLYPKLYQKYVTNKKGKRSFMLSWKNPYMARSRQHSRSVEIRCQAYRSGGSK